MNKPLIPIKFILPLGILLLAAGFIVKAFFNIPDYIHGFLIGAGIGIILLSIIKLWYTSRAEK
jgi:hypothetical protein